MTLTLDSAFENKDAFLQTLARHLAHHWGARKCKFQKVVIKDRPEQSVTKLDRKFPTILFKLAEDSDFSYSLEVQFGLIQRTNEEELALLSLLIQTHFARLHLKEVETRLKTLSHTDEVTNLFNQRKLYADIDEAIEVYHLNQLPFAFLFIDIDHFKLVNDNYGHLIGSHMLMQMSQIIRSEVRESDLVYRYGGDEFVVLLPLANAEEAHHVGERILAAVKAQEFLISPGIFQNLSVSIGVSDYPRTSKSREDVIRTADQMMYQAKKNGRGQVVALLS